MEPLTDLQSPARGVYFHFGKNQGDLFSGEQTEAEPLNLKGAVKQGTCF